MVDADTVYRVAERLDAGNHCFPNVRSVGLVLHAISDNGRRLEAHTSKELFVAANVFSRHGSPYVEGNGVKRNGRISVPCRFHVDFGNLGLGYGTMSAE